MTIKVDDTVKVVDNIALAYPDMIGKVEYTIYDVALVRFDNGDLVKYNVGNLVKVEPQESVKREIPKGAKEISKENFDLAVMEVTNPFTMSGKNPLLDITGSLSASIVGRDISEKIFKAQNVVTMTRDEFIATLWDGCTPIDVSKSTGGKMPVEKCIGVSIGAIMLLRKIVPIIFGDEADNNG